MDKKQIKAQALFNAAKNKLKNQADAAVLMRGLSAILGKDLAGQLYAEPVFLLANKNGAVLPKISSVGILAALKKKVKS
jgi:hypothetical protein